MSKVNVTARHAGSLVDLLRDGASRLVALTWDVTDMDRVAHVEAFQAKMSTRSPPSAR